ncbi:MAG: MBL fold metallo-hydrolase [Candidatus Hodarchaeales archaeon]
MKYPSVKVKNIHNILSENKDTLSNQEAEEKIQGLSEEERCQLFWLMQQTNNLPLDILSREIKIWNGVKAIFNGDYTSTGVLDKQNDLILTLTETGVYMGSLTLEDFRSVSRFLYTHANNYNLMVDQLNETVLRLLANITTSTDDLLKKLVSLIRFIGLPPSGFEHLKDNFSDIFHSSSSQIERLQELPIDTCQHYPEYIKELTEKLNYDKDIPVLKQWLNHSILNEITNNKTSQFIEMWPLQKYDSNEKFFQSLEAERLSQKITSIPLVYSTFVKPYSQGIHPATIRTSDLPSNIPTEMLPTYLERSAYPVHTQEEEIKVTFLGGASIGTMGILVTTPQSNILFDYGLSVANYQIPAWHEALPSLDAIFVTHAHLDHTGAIPYLFSQGYSGYVFGSSMTKKLTSILLADSIKLMNQNFSQEICKNDFRFKALSQESYLFQMLDRYITIKSGETYQITPDVAIKPFNANHIQGSYAYQMESKGKKVLFTGDVNFDPSELFRNKSPKLPIDSNLSIVDATYYGQPGFDSKKRDQLLFKSVSESKRVIIPAFSVGRAQEILLKLEKAGITKTRKVTLLGMATKIAQLSGIRTKGHLSNKLVQPFEDEIIITGGGMLSGGYARELVEQTKTDPKTTIILCGYLARNTLGYRLLHNLERNYKQNVVYTRFSGHTSSKTLKKVISTFKGSTALVHLGELTKDPLTLEKEKKREKIKDKSIEIPHLGSTMTI